ncbi:MAG: hypothetical protein ACYTBV_17630, partial [Planctomycetota bacterium]
EYRKAQERSDTEAISELAPKLDAAFTDAGGDIFTTLRQAQSYAFEKSILAQASGERFASQLKAYRASPKFYLNQQRLQAFEEVSDNIRKYVVVTGSDDNQIFIIDVQEKLTPGLYDLGGMENE